MRSFCRPHQRACSNVRQYRCANSTATSRISRNAATNHDEEVSTPSQVGADPVLVPSADGTKTLRRRRDGTRTLPLPPALDPRVLAARKRHKQPKEAKPSDAELTPFQKELKLNPWGTHSIASKHIRKLTGLQRRHSQHQHAHAA